MKASWWLVVPAAALLVCGAGSIKAHADSSDSEKDDEKGRDVQTIGDLARVFGLDSAEAEGIGLVVGLEGTGSDPPPSMWRTVLLEDMKRRGVENPNEVLASPSTALVLVRGYLRPELAKGGHFDVEVRVPQGSETISLRGGWLLETLLSDRAVMEGQLFEGNKLGKAAGPIMVAPAQDGQDGDRSLLTQGRILGGGVATTERPLALAMRPKYQTGAAVIRVAKRINRRFHSYGRGARLKEGMATAKTNKFVELRVAPRYRHNLPRYLEVIRFLPLSESALELQQRVAKLAKRLAKKETARRAALELEGAGAPAKDTLQEALENADPRVRFYAAEALAYLGDQSCARVLYETARDDPALRVWALTALTSLDEAVSHRVLRDLMDGNSAETRYGAFRALWALDPHDPFIRGEDLDGQFFLHVLSTRGAPMIHIARSFRPEIVVFGQDLQLQTPLMLKAGSNILVNASAGGDEAHVSRFALGEPPEKRVCSLNVGDVIRTAVELGATYPDMVWMLNQAQLRDAVPGRVEVDALPKSGRAVARRRTRETGPGLFPTDHLETAEAKGEASSEAEKADDEAEPEEEQQEPGFFAKLFGRAGD